MRCVVALKSYRELRNRDLRNSCESSIHCAMTDISNDLLAKLQEREKALKVELEEVKMLKAAIKGVASANSPARKRTRSTNNGPTFKDMIKTVLKEKGSGAEALELIDLIEDRFGQKIKRTSISPQLSRLKADGELTLIGKEWWLTGDLAAGEINTGNNKPSAETEGLSNEGVGWNQSGIPKSTPAGSNPVTSTPAFGGTSPPSISLPGMMPGIKKGV